MEAGTLLNVTLHFSGQMLHSGEQTDFSKILFSHELTTDEVFNTNVQQFKADSVLTNNPQICAVVRPW